MQYDVVIVGAGITGLATALQLKEKQPGLSIAILEKEKSVARHQTGNNSGVIHSGIYYKPGTLKAENCIRGYNMLVDFCRQHEVPFELCGKVIVATSPEELPLLETIHQRGIANGLQQLRRLNPAELKEFEPHVTGIAAIHVPQTGIVDYRLVAEKYAEVLVKKGIDLSFETKVTGIRPDQQGHMVLTSRGEWNARLVVTCGGLYSDRLAQMTNPEINVRIIPFRGEYYKLRPDREFLVRNLIYPVPDPNFPFLGVHFTRMAKGGVEAGPNAVLAFRREGYRKRDVHLGELTESLLWPGFQKVAAKYWRTGLGEMYRSFSKAAFTRALQKLVPEIQSEDLVEGGAGVRAQACDRTGGLVDDFLIHEQKGFIHLTNAPSPAATSSLAIGDTVSTMVLKQLS